MQRNTACFRVAILLAWLYFLVSIRGTGGQSTPLFPRHCQRLYWTHLSLSLGVCCPAVSSSTSVCSSILSGLVWSPLQDCGHKRLILLFCCVALLVWLIYCDALLPACQSQRRPDGTAAACLKAGFAADESDSFTHRFLNLSRWLSARWTTLTAILQTTRRYTAGTLRLNSSRSHTGLLPAETRLSLRSLEEHLNHLDVAHSAVGHSGAGCNDTTLQVFLHQYVVASRIL